MSQPTGSEPPIEEIRCSAWKYAGYKRFSRVVGYTPSFFVVRQFRTLNVRVILAMQDRLSELENNINALDDVLSRPTAPKVHNGRFRNDQKSRLDLLEDIQKKLKEYSTKPNPYP